MSRNLDLRASSVKRGVFGALVWFACQTASASIVGSEETLSDNLSANDGVATFENKFGEASVVPADDVAAPVRIDPPGDYNGSGLVEQGDLDLVLGNWGREVALLPTTWVNDRPAAMVNQSALDQVLINWGKAATFTSPVAHMPEASSMTVALLLLGSVAGARAVYRGIERRRVPVA